MTIRITVNEGHRVRDEHAELVTGPIERPGRTPYWVRRELDKEVTIEDLPPPAAPDHNEEH